MRIAIMELSLDMLRQVLVLPEETEILFVEQDMQDRLGRRAQLVMRDPSFAEVPEGGIAPHVSPEYKSICRGIGTVTEFDGWYGGGM